MNVRPDPMLIITAGVTGIVTSVTMIGPLLVDIAADLDVSLGQAGLLAAAAGVPQALFSPFSGWIAAGTVITDDVPPGSLAGFPPRQVTKEGWVYDKHGKRDD